MATLLKSQRALERSITTLRNEMDTLKQAQKIETSGSDDELRVLMERWRKASREVAEELYKDVRERVNRYVLVFSHVWFFFLRFGGWIWFLCCICVFD